MKYNNYTNIALKSALAGGRVLSKYFNKSLKIDFKGLINPVTEADRTSQEIIIKTIKKEFPDHDFLGEENETDVICREDCWIIDPLDGTVNFIHNIPIFCVSIAYSHKSEIISGVIHAPLLNETFICEKGKGAYLNNRKIKVSSINELIKSLVITGFPYSVHDNPGMLAENFSNVLAKVQGVRRLGSAALDLAYVASGRCEAFWEEGLHPWDVAAGSLLVKEAGGVVTDFENKNNFLFGKTILATNAIVHNQMREIIRK